MRYHLTVAGSMSDLIARSFAPTEVQLDDASTTLTVEVRDQAGLVGIIDRVGDLGLELIDLTRAPEGEPTPSEPAAQ